MSLKARLIAEMTEHGPLSVADYMARCLLDPEFGYYRTQPAFGTKGDFTTAPEISQMFGEILGAWIFHQWQAMGAPEPWHLIECGPGRGTLMADMLRTLATLSGKYHVSLTALHITLVEASPALRDEQKATLHAFDRPLTWQSEPALPDAPFLLIANEFLDALPVAQYQWIGGCWRTRAVTCQGDALTFTPDEPATPPHAPATPAEGDLYEHCPQAHALMAQLAARLRRQPGSALFLDYGYASYEHGDTLQAVRRHAYADPLAEPGLADLTAHVDFARLRDTARHAGAATFGPATQGDFLLRLGLRERAEQLVRATPSRRAETHAALNRLVAPEEMGTLFKALCLQSPNLPAPPGFSETA